MYRAPAFRIIRPRIFNNSEEDRTFEDALNEDNFEDPEGRTMTLNDSTEKLKPEALSITIPLLPVISHFFFISSILFSLDLPFLFWYLS